MFVIVTRNQKYGPFGEYKNALQFASQHWIQCEFYINGSDMETFFTKGIPVEL